MSDAVDGLRWRCHSKIEKYHGRVHDRLDEVEPYEVWEREGNLLMAGGADLMWIGMKTGLSATTGLKNTIFGGTAKGTAIGVGASSAAAAITQNNLQASSTKLRKKVDAGYPTHTTGLTGSTNQKMVFKTTFTTTQANWAWKEWGIFNSTANSTANSRMLNRVADNTMGTKTSSATWAITVTLSLA